ncbi:MAG: bacterial Ig-like domain-containing protein [Ruminococcus sp.]|nr:bacterial Ig-like domain-containing protein [Ruminococcus sp.]
MSITKKSLLKKSITFATSTAMAISINLVGLNNIIQSTAVGDWYEDAESYAESSLSSANLLDDMSDVLDAASNGLSAAQITKQIEDTYQAALKNSGRTSFNGFCGAYVNQQLLALGIVKKNNELGGNGNVWYSKMSNLKKTSAGYNIKMYPGKTCVADIWNANNKNNVYNIVVAFKYGYGDAGKEYGHVLLIHGIIDGKVYYSESSDWGSTKEGQVMTCDVSKFESRYTNLGHTFDGAGHFTTEVDTPVATKLSSIVINPDSIGTMYEDGSIFNPSGLTLTATYSDGSTKNITEGYTVGNVDLSTVGNSVLTVSYEGKTATADITVQDLFDGNGTAESPYLVNNASDLKMVADMTNNTAANNCYGHAYYKQTSDIDLGESDWISIGCFYANGDYSNVNNSAAFYGHYDGNCYIIRNLTMNYKNKYAGLFGRIANNSVVENLSVYGTINSTTLYSGGIVGEIGHGASVKNCSFTGSVTGSYYVGGITGKIYRGGSIINCYANAEITASDEKGVAGGILSIAQIDATSDTYNINISNCYFTGKINSFTNGGIIAQTAIADGASASMKIFNCYYLNNASTGVAQAGCTGLISSQLKTIATDLGSPFADNADDTLNNGYPVFEWQIETSDEKVSGDANNDGAIDLKDVVIIRRYVAGGWDVEIDASNADVNADNTVDLKDVVLIRRYIAGGWDVELK